MMEGGDKEKTASADEAFAGQCAERFLKSSSGMDHDQRLLMLGDYLQVIGHKLLKNGRSIADAEAIMNAINAKVFVSDLTITLTQSAGSC